MIHFIKALLQGTLKKHGVFLVLSYVCLLIISSLLIIAVEPADSGLAEFDDALWWSIVTSTTVGYGDLYPTTSLGRLIAVILPMFLGIGLGAAFISYLASCLIERRDKRMHGDITYTKPNHILIVGCTQETETLIQQIRRDTAYAKQEIVLLADIERHPFPDVDRLFFVRGRPDTLQTLNRANTNQAGKIIIHTGSDEDSLFALINVLKLKPESCTVTVRCLSTQSMDTFSSVPGDFELILQMTAEMMVQAMQDKVHLPLQILLRNNADQEIYRVTLPQSIGSLSWWDMHSYLMDRYGYLTFARQQTDGSTVVNPKKDDQVCGGESIWLIAADRPMNIHWPAAQE